MTSPAQLKYLNAIGIPVWVSRDRVREPVDLEANSHSEAVSPLDSLEDILSGLEDSSSKSNRQNIENNSLNQEAVKTASSEISKPSTIQAGNLLNEIGRTDQHIIFASGDLDADWMIIGESPESNEPHESQPYTADSGILISQMLKSVGAGGSKTSAHIVHAIKYSFSTSPNSNLVLNELLTNTIQKVSPKVIVIVGQISAQNLLQTKEPLARLRSKIHKLPDLDIPVVVTYYPTYLLSKPLDKRKAWEDLKLAMSLVQNADE